MIVYTFQCNFKHLDSKPQIVIEIDESVANSPNVNDAWVMAVTRATRFNALLSSVELLSRVGK